MTRKISVAFTLVVCLLSTHQVVHSSCIPTYRQAAPDNLDDSHCTCCFESYRLYKTSHWAIDWPDFPVFTNVDPTGKGYCYNSLKC